MGDNVGCDAVGLVWAIYVKVPNFALSTVFIWLLNFRHVPLQNGSSVLQKFKCTGESSPFANCYLICQFTGYQHMSWQYRLRRCMIYKTLWPYCCYFTDIQFKIVNVFVYKISQEEKDLLKHEKIDNLALSPAEWKQVKLFNDLLAVHCWKSPCFVCCWLGMIWNSMQTMLNMHSHLIQQPPCTLCCLHLKHSIKPGPPN